MNPQRKSVWGLEFGLLRGLSHLSVAEYYVVRNLETSHS